MCRAGSHDRPAGSQHPGAISRNRLSFPGDPGLSRQDRGPVEIELAQSGSPAERRRSGSPVRHSQSNRSRPMLQAAQSGSFVCRARRLRRLVHRVAPRAVAHPRESSGDRTLQAAEWQDPPEDQPSRQLDRERNLGLSPPPRHRSFAALRSGLHQHRMPAVHRASCERRRSSLRPLAGQGQAGVRHPYSGELDSMEIALGFIIAVFIALTGVGAGSLTTPLLILLLGLPAKECVGTALIFGTVVKVLTVPSYMARKQVNWRVFRYMTIAGIPAVIGGAFLLSRVPSTWVTALVGLTIASIALVNLFRFGHVVRPDRARWLSPAGRLIDTDIGFSSAGAGAIGALAMMSLTTLSTAEIVGTDLSF